MGMFRIKYIIISGVLLLLFIGIVSADTIMTFQNDVISGTILYYDDGVQSYRVRNAEGYEFWIHPRWIRQINYEDGKVEYFSNGKLVKEPLPQKEKIKTGKSTSGEPIIITNMPDEDTAIPKKPERIAYIGDSGSIHFLNIDANKDSNIGQKVNKPKQDEINISLDGSKIAYITQGELYVTEVNNPSPILVSKGIDKPSNPKWANDIKNHRLVFHNLKTIYIFLFNTKELVKYPLEHSFDIKDVLWTKDGSQIIYLIDNGLWILDLASGKSNSLIENDFTIKAPIVLTPDGRNILFARTDTRGAEIVKGGICIISIETKQIEQITTNMGDYEYKYPDCDAHTMGIIYLEEAFSQPSRIVIINRDGNGRKEIANAEFKINKPPKFSTNDKKVMFIDGNRLYTMHIDGSGKEILIKEAYAFAWMRRW